MHLIYGRQKQTQAANVESSRHHATKCRLSPSCLQLVRFKSLAKLSVPVLVSIHQPFCATEVLGWWNLIDFRKKFTELLR